MNAIPAGNIGVLPTDSGIGKTHHLVVARLAALPGCDVGYIRAAPLIPILYRNSRSASHFECKTADSRVSHDTETTCYKGNTAHTITTAQRILLRIHLIGNRSGWFAKPPTPKIRTPQICLLARCYQRQKHACQNSRLYWHHYRPLPFVVLHLEVESMLSWNKSSHVQFQGCGEPY